MTYTINFLTRGDIGFALTRSEQETKGFGIDWGIGFNFSYYLGNPMSINKGTLLGPTQSISFFGTNSSMGYDNSNNTTWVGVGSVIGFSFELTKGKGKTSGNWNK